MAPEQLVGDSTIDSAADLYSLAHVAYCLLVGRPYWFEEAQKATNAYAFVSTVVNGVSDPATNRARRAEVELPAAFDKWFAKAASKRVSRRFNSATEQVAALASALAVSAYAQTERTPVGVAPPVRGQVQSLRPCAGRSARADWGGGVWRHPRPFLCTRVDI